MLEELKDLILRAENAVNNEGYSRDAILRDVWNILAALRGPDNENGRLKLYTTGRIRAIVGLEFAKRCGTVVEASPLSDTDLEQKRILLRESTNHFRWHIEDAELAIYRLYKYDLSIEKSIID